MADVTFDPVNLRIVEISAGGDNELDWLEIYSEWKVWVAQSDNAKYPQAFRVVGGDPISLTQNLGSTFFLLFPWKFRPAELSHRLTLVGNLFSDPAGGTVLVSTLGSYTVLIEQRVSNLTDAVLLNSPEIQYASFGNKVTIDTTSSYSGTAYPVGTTRQPVNNLADALLIAAFSGFDLLHLKSSLTIATGQDVSDYILTGDSNMSRTITAQTGAIVSGASFRAIRIAGDFSAGGSVHFRGCLMDAVTLGSVTLEECVFISSVTFGGVGFVSAVLHNCWDGIAGGGTTPLIDFNSRPVQLVCDEYTGDLTVRNKSAAHPMSVDLISGRVTLEATVTAGAIQVRGVGVLENSSVGATVDATGLVNASVVATATWADASATALQDAVALIRKVTGNRLEVDIGQQRLELYDDDGTTLLQHWSLATNLGEPVVSGSGVQTKRGPPEPPP